MEHLLGLLRIHVQRGVNLAVRDVVSSDPYVVIKMGKQKLKTRVINKNVNPEWNDDLTLSVSDPRLPVHLVLRSIEMCILGSNIVLYKPIVQGNFQYVYDKDTFSFDDKMGEAEFDINPFLEAVKMRLNNLPDGTIITKIYPNRQNCLAEESQIVWKGGKIVQNMVLRLKNVESGEVELQLHWIDIPGSRGL